MSKEKLMFVANTFCRVLRIALMFLLMQSVSINIFAQDLDKFAPKTLKKEDAKTVDAPKLPVSKVKSKDADKVLIKHLKGIVFVRDPAKVEKDGVAAEGIRSDGYFSEEFYTQMGTYLKKPLTVTKINEILQQVVRYFRGESTPVVDIFVPEQDVTSGSVQIVILEGRIGEIEVKGNKWFTSERIVNALRSEKGDVIRGDKLAEDVNWLNRNPFRHIDVMLARGKNRGETDVILKTQDRFPVRVYGGFENTGNDLTGRNNFLAGINWGDAFGLGHLMDYQFTFSNKFFASSSIGLVDHLPRSTAHSLRYEIPLEIFHTLKFTAAASHGRPDIPPFDQETKSSQFTARYIWDLPTFDLIRHQAVFGMDYKYSNSDLAFASIPVFDKKTEIVQFILGYNSSYPDDWGRTALGLQLTLSPGDLTQYNDNEAFNDYKQGATAEYYYFNVDLDRLTRLPYDMVWDVKFHAQFADSTLIGSEQMNLGGYSSIRGFEENEANGDTGFSLINEVRTKSFDIASALDLSHSLGKIQFLGFVDYGTVKNRFEDGETTLVSVGVGTRYQYGSNVSLRFDYGSQISGKNVDNSNSSIAHFGLVIGL